MKDMNGIKIIGLDHGYGNIKTANHCFPTGILGYDQEPLFTKDMLVFNGRYYLIGEGHKEFLPDKSWDDDYYLLTLAAIAKELSDERITEAGVHLAVGLPLTWTAGQKAASPIISAGNRRSASPIKRWTTTSTSLESASIPKGMPPLRNARGR